MKEIFKKGVGYVVGWMMLSLMTYMVYTGNTALVNLVTVYYSVLMLVCWVFFPLVLISIATGKMDEDTLLKFEKLAKVKSSIKTVYNLSVLVLAVMLMSLLDYTFLPIMWVITSGFVWFFTLTLRTGVERELAELKGGTSDNVDNSQQNTFEEELSRLNKKYNK